MKIFSQIKDSSSNEDNIYTFQPAAHTENIEDGEESKYGLGSANKYGHCRVINNLDAETYKEGECLSAYQGTKLRNRIKKVELIQYGSNTWRYTPSDGIQTNQIIFLNVYYFGSEWLSPKINSINYDESYITILLEESSSQNLHAAIYITD
jgi:hypothetical protein